MNPLVSIITPCHNNAEFIRSAIASSLNQTYPNLEVIVIDDGSTDNSLEIIRSFDDSRLRWESQANQGAPVARNRGLVLAQGSLIKFLDADDILLTDCIERQVQQTQELSTNQKAIVYGDAIWVDREGNSITSYPPRTRNPEDDPIAHILNNSPLTSCPLHKREYLQAINGFDPSLPRAQEHDLHLRLVLSGVEFIYYSGEVYKYREHQDVNRISNYAYSRHGAFAHYEAIEKQKELIAQKVGYLSPEVKTVLAQRFWAYGRGILREGYKKEATRYFETARELSPNNCVNGNSPYPLLVKFLGAIRAEFVLQGVKSRLKKG
jgi:glycosyltransferase involved in cell wall biosynthesis